MRWIRNVLDVLAGCTKEKEHISKINQTGVGEELLLQGYKASQVNGQDFKEWKSSACEAAGPRNG